MDRLTISRALWLHLAPGAVLLALFCLIAPLLQARGIPTFAGILLLEALFLAPYVGWKLATESRRATGAVSLRGAIPYFERTGALNYAWLVPLGLVLAIGSFEILRPVDESLRHAIAGWLPSWHYAKDLEQHAPATLRWYFAAAIVIDGIIGPSAEELYFRGYLLPRLAHLRAIAPAFNGLLFAIYHFWQPMNYPSLIAASLVLSYSAWFKRDVRVPWAIHCAMNTLGHTLGFLGTYD